LPMPFIRGLAGVAGIRLRRNVCTWNEWLNWSSLHTDPGVDQADQGGAPDPPLLGLMGASEGDGRDDGPSEWW
jgi:hypothetical protein